MQKAKSPATNKILDFSSVSVYSPLLSLMIQSLTILSGTLSLKIPSGFSQKAVSQPKPVLARMKL